MLQLSDAYNQPLQAGSLPPTLTFLHLGAEFDQPLAPGVLPESLRCLVGRGPLGERHLLAQRLLPASLQRLSLDHWPHALEVGALPQQLKALHMAVCPRPHIALQPQSCPPPCCTSPSPASLDAFCPTSSPPPSSSCTCASGYDYPLLPGVLPPSLRRLVLSRTFSQPLQLGSLPEGLLFLCFHSRLEVES